MAGYRGCRYVSGCTVCVVGQGEWDVESSVCGIVGRKGESVTLTRSHDGARAVHGLCCVYADHG
jgi:hypothetical protein